jgi:hypothetical protein
VSCVKSSGHLFTGLSTAARMRNGTVDCIFSASTATFLQKEITFCEPGRRLRITIDIRKLSDMECSKTPVTVCDVLVYLHFGRSQFRSLIFVTHNMIALYRIRSRDPHDGPVPLMPTSASNCSVYINDSQLIAIPVPKASCFLIAYLRNSDVVELMFGCPASTAIVAGDRATCPLRPDCL